MKLLRNIIYIALLLLGLFVLGQKEIKGRSNIKKLGRLAKGDSTVTLYTGNNLEITSIDSLDVRTIFPTGAIRVARGPHRIGVKFSKTRFYVITRNETYANFSFNLNFPEYGDFTFAGFENKQDNKIYCEPLAGLPKEAERFYKDSIIPEILAQSTHE
ncbi:hypothetical protein HGH93_19305 [Chitinophaga polysaccharea]|uniref:hypothetical protein n=1 Tax=Chitinophaga polysaccharea TaxID=1293035 RepID=UPI0014556A75|nr:hypothetical protein [Chitinophaga polysaccharea]NLR60267.1 hypothetical protein [Chitinophaga polysaccharea]